MIGKPKFKKGDKVSFKVKNDDGIFVQVEGKIEIIDTYGVFEDNSDVYYDVMADKSHLDGNPCLYKHLKETCLKKI